MPRQQGNFSAIQYIYIQDSTCTLSVRRSETVFLSGGEGVFAEAASREALFSGEVYDAGNNSDIVELSRNRFVVVRVAEKQPSKLLPFDSVASTIRDELEARAQVAARLALLESVRSRLADGERLEEVANAEGYEWRVELATRRSGSLLPAEVLNLAFSMELGTVPALDKVDLVNGDLALVELARIEPGKLQNLSSSEQAAMTTQLARLQGQLSMLEYRSALRASAAIVTR